MGDETISGNNVYLIATSGVVDSSPNLQTEELKVKGQVVYKTTSNSADLDTAGHWYRIATLPASGGTESSPTGRIKIKAYSGSDKTYVLLELMEYGYYSAQGLTDNKNLTLKPVGVYGNNSGSAKLVITHIRIIAREGGYANYIDVKLNSGLDTYPININVSAEIMPDVNNEAEFSIGGWDDDTTLPTNYSVGKTIRVAPVSGCYYGELQSNLTGLSGVNAVGFYSNQENSLFLEENSTTKSVKCEEDCYWNVSYNITVITSYSGSLEAWVEVSSQNTRHANIYYPSVLASSSYKIAGSVQLKLKPDDLVYVKVYHSGTTYQVGDSSYPDRYPTLRITRMY